MFDRFASVVFSSYLNVLPKGGAAHIYCKRVENCLFLNSTWKREIKHEESCAHNEESQPPPNEKIYYWLLKTTDDALLSKIISSKQNYFWLLLWLFL